MVKYIDGKALVLMKIIDADLDHGGSLPKFFGKFYSSYKGKCTNKGLDEDIIIYKFFHNKFPEKTVALNKIINRFEEYQLLAYNLIKTDDTFTILKYALRNRGYKLIKIKVE
jgi:hypothetical protein